MKEMKDMTQTEALAEAIRRWGRAGRSNSVRPFRRESSAAGWRAIAASSATELPDRSTLSKGRAIPGARHSTTLARAYRINLLGLVRGGVVARHLKPAPPPGDRGPRGTPSARREGPCAPGRVPGRSPRPRHRRRGG